MPDARTAKDRPTNLREPRSIGGLCIQSVTVTESGKTGGLETQWVSGKSTILKYTRGKSVGAVYSQTSP